MAYMRLNTGLGQGAAAVIASAIGPLVKGGADIYATHEGAKISREELKQREREFARLQELAQQQLKAQQEQYLIGEHAKLQKATVSGYWFSRNMPYIVGAVGLVAMAVIAASLLRGGKK